MECFFEGVELYIIWFLDFWLNGEKILIWKNIKNKKILEILVIVNLII